MRIGTSELLVVLLIAFMVFGPKRLPEIGEALGKTIHKFKKEADINDDRDG